LIYQQETKDQRGGERIWGEKSRGYWFGRKVWREKFGEKK
jgi:hypothetical protein